MKGTARASLLFTRRSEDFSDRVAIIATMQLIDGPVACDGIMRYNGNGGIGIINIKQPEPGETGPFTQKKIFPQF